MKISNAKLHKTENKRNSFGKSFVKYKLIVLSDFLKRGLYHKNKCKIKKFRKITSRFHINLIIINYLIQKITFLINENNDKVDTKFKSSKYFNYDLNHILDFLANTIWIKYIF